MSRLGLSRLVTRAGLALTNDASLKGRPVARLLVLNVLCSDRHAPSKVVRERQRVGCVQSRGRLFAASLAKEPRRKQCYTGKRQYGDESNPFHKGKVLGEGGEMGCHLRSSIPVMGKFKTIAVF